jgi:pilus assembly protein Flp/PilA
LVFLWQRRKIVRTFAQHALEFLKEDDGPTAVEYAVMLALILVVCLIAITALGTNTNQTFTKVNNAIASS